MPATRGELFAGVTVALVTPFKNGAIDWDDLGKLVDWHCEQGTDALAPCGTGDLRRHAQRRRESLGIGRGRRAREVAAHVRRCLPGDERLAREEGS